MSADLKPGDRALVLQDPADPEYAGTIVSVLSEARVAGFYNRHQGLASIRYAAMHELEFHDGRRGYLPPQLLVRLPPDADAVQPIRETEAS